MVSGTKLCLDTQWQHPPATLWRDGILRVTAAQAMVPTLADASQVLVIGGLNVSGFGTIGGIGLVSAWDRPLADWEMRALLHNDPMGLVRPATPRTFFIPSAPSIPLPDANLLLTEAGDSILTESGDSLQI